MTNSSLSARNLVGTRSGSTSIVANTQVSETKTWRKFYKYNIDIDEKQDDKANEILLCSFERPHMRAFHCSWIAFFVAFFVWFCIGPLLPYIADDLGLTKKEIWTSSIAGVGSTIAVRFALGPLCDVYGPRVLMAAVLCFSAIPTACTGLIRNATDLIVLRCFIGVAGGSFVMCQYWTSRMFCKEVVGTANALVGGWGNLGAGFTNLVIGSYIFPLFQLLTNGDTETAWRTVSIVPAVAAFAVGIAIYRCSDDSPKGNYSQLKEHGVFPKNVSISTSFSKSCRDWNTWILFIQYACCFGVELTMNNAAALYFRDEFDQTVEAAGAIASIFGWLNFFARGLGGFCSDAWNQRWGMRGRLWANTLFLLLEGALVLVFATTSSLGGAICCLVFFSLFVQAAEGTNFAIVPYVDPRHTGSVSGIVGAGGNVGAVAFGMAFRQLDYVNAFGIMGGSILISSLLSVLIKVDGHAGLFWGKDEPVDPETGKVCEKQGASDEEIQSIANMAAC